MTKRSDRQIAMLTAAAAAPIEAGGPDTAKTAASLIKRGLLISLPRAGGPSRLLITAAGRTAIGLSEEAATASTSQIEAELPNGPEQGGQPSDGGAPKGKLGVLVGLLRRQEGATIDELIAATGWQAHSVRGAIAGSIKKKLGLSVASTKADGGGRLYRIVEGAGA